MSSTSTSSATGGPSAVLVPAAGSAAFAGCVPGTEAERPRRTRRRRYLPGQNDPAGPPSRRLYAARPVMKSRFVIFGLVVLLLGVAIPAWAITREGSGDASPESVPSNLDTGKELFVTNCGACHTLAKAGTDGVIGPNLDELLAPPSPTPPDPSTIKPRVLSAIENGVAGRMPKGVLSGQQADQVATFVSQVAGQGP